MNYTNIREGKNYVQIVEEIPKNQITIGTILEKHLIFLISTYHWSPVA